MNSTALNQHVVTVTPEQAQRCIALLWKADATAKRKGGAISPALIGGVGCGKTTAVKEFVSKMQRNDPSFALWSCALSLMEPSDIGGIPVPDKKTGRYSFYLPSFLPFDCDDHGVIFGDEFDRATPEVQNAFLQVLLGCDFHGHSMSSNAFCVLALNGTSDMYTTPLSRAARTRVCTLFVSRDSTGGDKSYREWAQQNDVNPAVVAFAKYRPELYESENDFEELALCVSRSADRAGDILEAAKTVQFQTDDILLACVAGCIGKKAAIELMAVERLITEAPSPEEIVAKGGHGCVIPQNQSVIYALLGSISSQFDPQSKTEANAYITYGKQLPDEWTAVLFESLCKKQPHLRTDHRVMGFFNDNQKMMH